MIYPLNEVATKGPITFKQAVKLMQPEDRFELVFQRKVVKYGATVFKPGKVYRGSKVMFNGRIRVKHEDIFIKGSTSTFTKEEFLEELKTSGDPCNLLDCNKSVFIRPGPGGGEKTFAEALKNPSFERTPSSLPVEPVQSEPTPSRGPESGKFDPGEALETSNLKSNNTADRNIDIYIPPSTDKIKINKTKDNEYIISYNGMSNVPLEDELKRLFGYQSWQEYKKDNFEDLTKKTPTVHPFHVAYALEEFANNLKAADYDLVGIPSDSVGITINEKTLVDVVHGLRKGFFGSAFAKGTAALGILNIVMYSPVEGLKNSNVIDRLKDNINIAEKVLQVFSKPRFVKHPNGSFWRRDMADPFLTSKRGEAMIVKPADVVTDPAVLMESKNSVRKVPVYNALNEISITPKAWEELGPEVLKYYILPAGWRSGEAFTKAEIQLAKKIGANYSSGFMVTPSGEKMILNLRPPTQRDFKPREAAIKHGDGLENAVVLAFGHSQAGAYKSTIKNMLPKNASIPSLPINGAGHSDGWRNNEWVGIENLIKQIPKKDWTHAFLFLGGNTGVKNYDQQIINSPGLLDHAPDYGKAKRNIINYVVNDLNIPKDRIVVVLPPINNDPSSGQKSIDNRKLQHSRAISFFNSLGIKVAPIAIGGEENFRIEKDKNGNQLTSRYHIKANSDLAKKASQDILANFSSTSMVDQELPTTSQAAMSRENPLSYTVSAVGMVPLTLVGQKPARKPTDSEITKIVVNEANKAGVDAKMAVAMAKVEGWKPQSGMKTDKSGNVIHPLRLGGYHGLFQYGTRWTAEWEKYGLDWNKVYDTQHASETFMKIIENKVNFLRSKGYLKKSTVGNMHPSEAWLIYLSWQQGNSGAISALRKASRGEMATSHARAQNYYGKLPGEPGRKPLAKSYRDMKKEAKRLGLKSWTRLPEDNPVKLENTRLRSKLSAELFLSDWERRFEWYKKKASKAMNSANIGTTSDGVSTTSPVIAKTSKRNTRKDEPNHSFIFGDLRYGGQIYEMHNQNQVVASGASMNKPILALVQLLKYRNDPVKRLNKKELDGLLAYTGHESNNVNRLISGRDPKTKALRERRKTIGMVTEEDTKIYLEALGLDPNMKIRYGGRPNNAQSSKQFFDFMRLIHDRQRIEELGIIEEVSIIVGYMKRSIPGVSMNDRESRRWPKLVEQLRMKGLPVENIYGKGGLIKKGLHYGFVINDRYLLVMYSDKGNSHRQWFYDKVESILRRHMSLGG